MSEIPTVKVEEKELPAVHQVPLKKPLTPYMMYATQERVFYSRANPDMSFGATYRECIDNFPGDIAKAGWKMLSNEQKQPYYEHYAVLKGEYDVRDIQWRDNLSQAQLDSHTEEFHDEDTVEEATY